MVIKWGLGFNRWMLKWDKKRTTINVEVHDLSRKLQHFIL